MFRGVKFGVDLYQLFSMRKYYFIIEIIEFMHGITVASKILLVILSLLFVVQKEFTS